MNLQKIINAINAMKRVESLHWNASPEDRGTASAMLTVARIELQCDADVLDMMTREIPVEMEGEQ